MKKKDRRPQTEKPAKSGNSKYMEGMQELRKGSRTSRHAMATDYRRKPKYGRWEE